MRTSTAAVRRARPGTLPAQKLNKQRTIDDFVACASYLVEKRYSSPAHLAARGTSAGGPAVGGFIT